jgi:hypothetical protein
MVQKVQVISKLALPTQTTLSKKKRQNNNRLKRSLHCLQLDQHDADGLAGHKILEDRPDHHKEK